MGLFSFLFCGRLVLADDAHSALDIALLCLGLVFMLSSSSNEEKTSTCWMGDSLALALALAHWPSN